MRKLIKRESSIFAATLKTQPRKCRFNYVIFRSVIFTQLCRWPWTASDTQRYRWRRSACNTGAKGAITSKIKHAIKHKTSPARLAQLLQPSLAFCFSLQPMTAYRPGQDGTDKLKQNANEGCNSCASLAGPLLSFIACFILLVIAP